MKQVYAQLNQFLTEAYPQGVEIVAGHPHYVAGEMATPSVKYVEVRHGSQWRVDQVTNSLRPTVRVDAVVRVREVAQDFRDVAGDVLLWASDFIGRLSRNDALVTDEPAEIDHIDGTTTTVDRDTTPMTVLPFAITARAISPPIEGVVGYDITVPIDVTIGEDVWQPREGVPDAEHRFSEPGPVPLRNLFVGVGDDEPQRIGP